MRCLEPILDAFAEGRAAVFVTGRSLHDPDLDESGKVRPLFHLLARRVRERFQMTLVRFNLAQGVTHEFGDAQQAARDEFNQGLRLTQLDAPLAVGGNTRMPHERALEILRALQAAAHERRQVPKMLVLFEFSEDLAPVPQNGQASDTTVQLAEFAVLLASDLRLRDSGIFFVFHGDEAHLEPRVARALPELRLAQPGRADKRTFLDALQASTLRSAAQMEHGLDADVVAHLTAGTPNAGLEQTFLAAARSGRPVRQAELIARKRADVLRLSEGTLGLVDTARARGVRLAGRNVQPALRLLRQWTASLRAGRPHTPLAVVLAGAASSAKTQLATLAAEESGVPAFTLNSARSMWVGESERRAALQMRLVNDFSPCVTLVDEITERLPLNRGETRLDSGASASVAAELLTSLSDQSRAGRCMLVATTNRPWAMDSAMANRFTFLPVLSALREDYAAILGSILAAIGTPLDERNAKLIEAAGIFYEKSLPPRTMQSVLSNAISETGAALSPDEVLAAARDACEAERRDRLTAEYADLCAIKHTTSARFFPWHGDRNYPFPEHLRPIVRESGGVNADVLNARLAELQHDAKL